MSCVAASWLVVGPEGFHHVCHVFRHGGAAYGMRRPWLLPRQRHPQDLRGHDAWLHIRRREHGHVPTVCQVACSPPMH